MMELVPKPRWVGSFHRRLKLAGPEAVELDEDRAGAAHGRIDIGGAALELLQDVAGTVAAVVEHNLEGVGAGDGADGVGGHVVEAAEVALGVEGHVLPSVVWLGVEGGEHAHVLGGVVEDGPAAVGGGQARLGGDSAEQGKQESGFHLPRALPLVGLNTSLGSDAVSTCV